MNDRLLAGALTIWVAACGASTTSTPARSADSDQPCGYDILANVKQDQGACLEPAILGADKTTRCEDLLLHHGWQRDAVAEGAIHQQSGKAVRCFRAQP
jgi:uncharacterized low-complexity protein